MKNRHGMTITKKSHQKSTKIDVVEEIYEYRQIQYAIKFHYIDKIYIEKSIEIEKNRKN